MNYLSDYRWQLIALTIVVMLGVTFLEDFKRDRGQHRAAKALHAIFLTAFSLYALRYFEMLGQLRGFGLMFYADLPMPGLARTISVIGLLIVVSGVFSAISAFMMRGRWNLARQLFMWIILVNGIAHTVFAIFIMNQLDEDVWNSRNRLSIIWIPLSIAIVANVLYRLPLMRSFFGYREARVTEEDVIDDVVMESDNDRPG